MAAISEGDGSPEGTPAGGAAASDNDGPAAAASGDEDVGEADGMQEEALAGDLPSGSAPVHWPTSCIPRDRVMCRLDRTRVRQLSTACNVRHKALRNQDVR